MAIIGFGDFVKQARTVQNISSRNLSTKLGKAITYISQIEKGKIKTFDYITCYRILELLNFDSNNIETILADFNIMAPPKDLQYVQFNFVSPSKKVVEIPSQEAEKNLHWLIDDEAIVVKAKNATLHESFNILIDKDVSRATKLISNLVLLTKDKENFEFLCQLFLNDLSTLDKERKSQIINQIKQLKGGN
jgi:transcriptional regulator with XRE-family HTH domain